MVTCDVCGRETPTAYIVKIEGATLVACPRCAERGEIVGEYGRREILREEEAADVVEDFAERIREARKKKGLKIQQLSELTGIRPRLLKLFEEGRAVPTLQQARSLERTLGIELLEPFVEIMKGKKFELTLGDVVRIR